MSCSAKLSINKLYNFGSLCFRRDPESLIRPLKQSATDEEKQRHKDALNGKVPKVTRHLILIRHGQYHDTEKGDHKRVLTQLGTAYDLIVGTK